MTALEERLRAELPRHANRLMDFYPLRGTAAEGQVPPQVMAARIDETVFGPRQPERAEPEYPAFSRECRAHGVRWQGDAACWCRAAGIAPLKNY